MAERPPRRCLAALAAAAVLMLAGCTGSGSSAPSTAPQTPTSAPSAPSTPASSSAPAPEPAPQPKPRPNAKPTNPLTGEGPVPKAPVIAVKIDDTAPGRPQVGIDRADVVYVEAVEGGLTRLAAIFASTDPTAVGYVRSTRPSDPDLLLQYGTITEAYSGGAHDSLPRLYRSGIKSWSDDAGAPFYRRVNRPQSDYINVLLNLAQVAARVHTARPASIGWTFARSIGSLKATAGSDVRTVVTGSYTTGTPVEFRWDGRLHAYVRYIDGRRQFAADGKPITATNVVVQSCVVRSHPRDTDINGNPSQFTYTVGRGAVAVFRQGRRIDGFWSRPKLHGGTALLTAAGRPIPLMPGNTWVALIRRGVPVRG